MHIFVTYISVAVLASSVHAFGDVERAVEVQLLDVRAAAAGGWALLNPVCPTNAQTCDGSFCCPVGLECEHNGNGNHCCPTGTNCLAAYQSSPQCADDSWSLWKVAKTDTAHGYFCCLPGQIGTNAGTCVTSNTPVVSSLSASLLAAATGTSVPTSSFKSSVSAATKSSSPSTAIASTAASISVSPGQDSATSLTQSSTTSSQTAQQTVKSGASTKISSLTGQFLPVAMLAAAFAAI